MAVFLFKKKELEIFFGKIYNLLESGGFLIIDPGGSKDNLFSLICDEIYLPAESYFIFLLSKLFGRQYFLFKKHKSSIFCFYIFCNIPQTGASCCGFSEKWWCGNWESVWPGGLNNKNK